MRVRFFPSLDSDTNALIMSYMLRIDLALMRVVCSEWRKWIPPQRLTFEKDFRNIPEWYDRSDYIAAVEKNIVFPPALANEWDRPSNITVVDNYAKIHTLLYYYRRINYKPSIGAVWNCCTFEEMQTIVLPMLMVKSKWMSKLFWVLLLSKKQKARRTLDWLFEKGFNVKYGGFIAPSLPEDRIDDIVFGHLKYLHDTKKLDNWFWENYLKKLWTEREVIVNKARLIDLVIMCDYVPPVACSKVTDAEHEKFIHICGCEKVVTYKKRKV